ncbi:MAG: helix-turn-helix transcriptional regulator [Gordonibacter sp.]|uniref:helix-turn-helix transcriptional regulator n=1 Tax=Gordonibacter sp. TaxID=1968902 RepID=UPI002FC80FA8
MHQYLIEHKERYRNQGLGFAFFLAWNYFSFFSCGLVPVIHVIRSSERVWMWTGLFFAVTSLVIMLISTRIPLAGKRGFGVIAAICSCGATIVIWMSFYDARTYQMVSVIGGMIAGVGLAMMAHVWGDRLSRNNESDIEFSVPTSFIFSFIIYFVLLALKGPVPMLVDAALPVASMLFAFRRPTCNLSEEPELSEGRCIRGGELIRMLAGIATLCLLLGLLWFQFAYFRLLATPEMVSDRFLHYLLPFSCSFLLSIIALLFCIKLSRYVNFTLMFRWGLPLLLLSYALLYYDYSDPLQKIVAYTVNFIGMFGVQFGFWLAAPKFVRRSHLPPSVLFGGMLAAEGVGIFIGTGYGLSIIDGISATNVMNESLLFFVILLLVAMMVGFNPCWSFFRASERWSVDGEMAVSKNLDEGSVSDDINALFEQQAEDLRRSFNLSKRETEIAALLLAGRSRPYIRDELTISLNTVHAHTRNIYTKCDVHSQREFMDLPHEKEKQQTEDDLVLP